jgi:hypothetical protein
MKFILPLKFVVGLTKADMDNDVWISTGSQTSQSRNSTSFQNSILNPPPTVTMSDRNRKTSRKFDFSEAFGPTRKALHCNGTSTERKIRQFFK